LSSYKSVKVLPVFQQEYLSELAIEWVTTYKIYMLFCQRMKASNYEVSVIPTIYEVLLLPTIYAVSVIEQNCKYKLVRFIHLIFGFHVPSH